MGKFKCQEELRSEEKERAANTAPRDPPRRLSDSPSKESPSPLSADSLAEVVSRESPLTSTVRPAPSSRVSSRTLSETPSPTPNTPREGPSPLSMSSTLSRDKAEPSTVSAVDQIAHRCVTVYYHVFLNILSR